MTKKSKIILVTIIALIIVGAGAYLYFWYQNTSNLRVQAQEQIDKIQKFNTVSDEIEKEKTRCQQFISQESGQFGEFEYCQRFIQWQKTLNISN